MIYGWSAQKQVEYYLVVDTFCVVESDCFNLRFVSIRVGQFIKMSSASFFVIRLICFQEVILPDFVVKLLFFLDFQCCDCIEDLGLKKTD